MPQLASLGLRALYECIHASYSVLAFLSYLLSLVTTPVERRSLVHRCLHPLSGRHPHAPATPASFTPSASLVSSSRPPFPAINKHPAHLAFAFPSSSVPYPLLPYLVLWAVQSGAQSLTLHSPHSAVLQCASQLADSLAAVSQREEGSALRSVEVCIRTKRRLRVREVERWTAEERQRAMEVVGRGQLPTVSEVWSVNGGRCRKHDSQRRVFNEEQRYASGRVSGAGQAAGKQSAKAEEAEEETKEAATERKLPNGKRKANGVASHRASNGHSHSTPPHAASQHSPSPFIVTLTAAEHTWDDIVNSVHNIALPVNASSSSSSVAPFPPPNDPAPPSSVLRSHILATAFPLYPISEPDLLLVFSEPLSLLSFPPWLQRLCELDSRPARHAAVWTRREFEQAIQRYSTTVQRGGA